MNATLLARSFETVESQIWLRKISPVVEQIKDARIHGERDRYTSKAIISALTNAGVHRMWVSKAFGGGQVALPTGMAVIQALAMQDASVAWQMGVQGAIGRLSDYLAPDVANHIFGHPGLVVGVVNPTGRARPTDGGFILNGEWSFASGSAHADWLVCAAMEEGDPGKAPASRMLFVPRDDFVLDDDWHTLGLRGTGSSTFKVRDVFVPMARTVEGADMLRPPPARPSRGYGIGYYDFGPFTSSSTSLGIARSALSSFRDTSIDRRRSGALPSSHTVYEKFGRAEALVRASQLMLSDAADQAIAHGTDGGSNLSALVRLTAATVAENTAAAVDTVYRLSGASGVYERNPLEKCFRDIHTATKHITLSVSHIELVGEYLLGGELLMRRQ